MATSASAMPSCPTRENIPLLRDRQSETNNGLEQISSSRLAASSSAPRSTMPSSTRPTASTSATPIGGRSARQRRPVRRSFDRFRVSTMTAGSRRRARLLALMVRTSCTSGSISNTASSVEQWGDPSPRRGQPSVNRCALSRRPFTQLTTSASSTPAISPPGRTISLASKRRASLRSLHLAAEGQYLRASGYDAFDGSRRNRPSERVLNVFPAATHMCERQSSFWAVCRGRLLPDGETRGYRPGRGPH